jgi:predicted dehydrogenase
VLEAAQRGVHLLVEKPFATTVADAEQMLKAVNQAGIHCQVAFENRWNPAFAQARAAIARGELGEVELMNARLNDTLFVPTRMLSWAARSTVGWFLLPHLVDLALWLSDKTPTFCYATASKRVLLSLGVDTWDSIHAILKFDDGTHAIFETCWILPTSLPTLFDFKFEIVGQHGALFIDTQDQMVHQASQMFTYPGTLVTEVDGRLRGFPVDMLDSFIACLVENRPPATTAEYGAWVTRIVAAIHESAQCEQVVPLL